MTLGQLIHQHEDYIRVTFDSFLREAIVNISGQYWKGYLDGYLGIYGASDNHRLLARVHMEEGDIIYDTVGLELIRMSPAAQATGRFDYTFSLEDVLRHLLRRSEMRIVETKATRSNPNMEV